jgi:hypothetical protein
VGGAKLIHDQFICWLSFEYLRTEIFVEDDLSVLVVFISPLSISCSVRPLHRAAI